MRIGIFGGSFDPPHNGHLLAASDAFEHLKLDRLTFVPAFAQPLKDRPAASGRDRLEMVRLLAGSDSRFVVDPIEVERDRLSYTVETLETFAVRDPRSDLFLIIGADVMPSFPRWREPDRIRELATLAVLRRGEGGVPDVAGGDVMEQVHRMQAEADRESGANGRGAPIVIENRRVDISSTEIRARVREGRAVRGFVPDPIADYITRHRLYRDQDTSHSC